MNINSIKIRFLLLFSICIGAIVLLCGAQHMYAAKHSIQNDLQLMAASLAQELSELRQLEQFYFASLDPEYTDKLERKLAKLDTDFAEFFSIKSGTSIDENNAIVFASALSRYNNAFAQLKIIHSRQSYDEDAELLTNLHALEKNLLLKSASNNVSLTQILEQLKSATRTFFATKNVNDAFVIDALSLSLYDQSLYADSVVPFEEVDQYRGLLLDFTDKYSPQNTARNLRLHFALIESASALENYLIGINEVAHQKLVKQRDELLVFVSVVTMTLLLCALYVFVTSFALFQRSFSSLVTFFYRSFRLQQKIDLRYVELDEFKTFAMMANELIVDRQKMQIKLASAEAELALLKKG